MGCSGKKIEVKRVTFCNKKVKKKQKSSKKITHIIVSHIARQVAQNTAIVLSEGLPSEQGLTLEGLAQISLSITRKAKFERTGMLLGLGNIRQC